MVGPHRIRLTHLDRVYWPADPALKQAALTKRDLLRYFAQVSPFIVPHLTDRPLTMIRMPEGIQGQRFFQKHWEQERPDFVETITVFSDHKDESHEYLLCNNLPTLLWLAQSGTLDSTSGIRARGRVRRSEQERRLRKLARRAGRLGAELSRLRGVRHRSLHLFRQRGARRRAGAEHRWLSKRAKEVAFWLRELLQGMSLEPVVKTSGKTGLHVFVPIRRTIDFDAARRVCEMVGRHLMRQHPKDITMEWSVPEANRQDLHGLQHERARQDVECRLLAARRAGRARLDAADLGRAGGRRAFDNRRFAHF